MTKPTIGELRAASANIMAANLAASMFPWAPKRAADQERYFIDAYTIGASQEDAERLLAEVTAELAATGAPGDAYRVAYRRLLDYMLGVPRPSEAFRDVARQALAVGGESLHPEYVDSLARSLVSYCEPVAVRLRWYVRVWRWLRKTVRRAKGA